MSVELAADAPTDVTPAPVDIAELRRLADARNFYEERLHWPVMLNVRHNRLVLRLGEVVGAVRMPASLGHRVLVELQIAMLSGPVLLDPSGDWWIFLTGVASQHREDVLASLGELDVHPMGVGSAVIVPGDPATRCSWTWMAEPRPDRPLPPPGAVIATAQRVGYRRRRRAA